MLKYYKKMPIIGLMISFSAIAGCTLEGTYEEPRHVVIQEPADECFYETADGLILPLEDCTMDRVVPVY
jgi:hypothetical protein